MKNIEIKDVIELSQDAIAVLDQDGQIRDFNFAALSLVNSKTSLIRGKFIYDFLGLEHPSDGTGWQKNLSTLTGEINFRVLGQDYVGLISHLVKNDETILVIKDITLEKRLHQSFKQQISELKIINSGLEAKVEERTKKLTTQKNLLSSIYDSIDEIIIISSLDGTCLIDQPDKTKHFFNSIELSGAPLVTLLFQEVKDQEDFSNWLSVLCQELLPFEDLLPLAVKVVSLNEKKFQLRFRLIEEPNKQLVTILKDLSEIDNLTLDLQKAKKKSEFLTRYLSNPSKMLAKFPEWDAMIDKIMKDLEEENPTELLPRLHLLKGALILDSLFEEFQFIQSIELQQIDLNHENLEKLKNMLEQRKLDLNVSQAFDTGPVKLSSIIQNCRKILNDSEFPYKLTQHGDLSLEKENAYKFEHLLLQHFRNLIAHAFQAKDERIAEGKSERNEVVISIEKVSEKIKIQITDDGHGLKKNENKNKKRDINSGMGQGLKGIALMASELGGSYTLQTLEGKTVLELSLPPAFGTFLEILPKRWSPV